MGVSEDEVVWALLGEEQKSQPWEAEEQDLSSLAECSAGQQQCLAGDGNHELLSVLHRQRCLCLTTAALLHAAEEEWHPDLAQMARRDFGNILSCYSSFAFGLLKSGFQLMFWVTSVLCPGCLLVGGSVEPF